MKVQEILSQLKFYRKGHFPRKALEAAIEQKTEITSHLLDTLEDSIVNTQKYIDSPTLMWHVYAVYLLAQFREAKAYPLIVAMLSKPDDIPFQFFGDSVTEDMGAILAAVSHGDLSLIKQMIESENVNEYVRSTCFTALVTLYVERVIEREDVIKYLRELFQGKLTRKTHFIWAALVSTCNDIYADILIDDIKQAYYDELPEPGVISIDYIVDTFKKDKSVVLSELYEKRNNHFLTDVISEIKSWSSFNIPLSPPKKISKVKKVGRNDPCPCGSGKKYKKCCLH